MGHRMEAMEKLRDAKKIIVMHRLPVNAGGGADAKVASPKPRGSRIRPSSHLFCGCNRNSVQKSFFPFVSTCLGRISLA